MVGSTLLPVAARVSILKRRRVEMKLSVEDVAQAVGVSPETLSRWERGKTRPHWNQLKTWERVMDALKEVVE